MRISDWSSYVCSSDLERLLNARVIARSVICGSEGLTVAPQGIAAMRSPMRILLAVLLALVCVPMWNGVPRLPLLGDRAVIHAERVALREGHTEVTRIGQLEWLGGVSLTSPDPDFGGTIGRDHG